MRSGVNAQLYRYLVRYSSDFAIDTNISSKFQEEGYDSEEERRKQSEKEKKREIHAKVVS